MSSKGHSVLKVAPRLSRCALSWKSVRSSTMMLSSRIVYTKQTVELSIDLSIAHFLSNGAPNDTKNKGPEQSGTTFR